MSKKEEPKVTGIGGIFFKSQDPKKTMDWYSDHLGIATDEYGSLFKFRNEDNPDQVNHLQWSVFNQNTKYFDPSDKEFMINYRVNDLVGLVKQLRSKGVIICDEIQSFEYGKFVHILDPENNKIELWEPIDKFFEESEQTKD